MNTEAEILNNIINSKLSPMIHKKDFKKGKKQTKFCQLTHTSVRGSTRKRPLKDSRGRLPGRVVALQGPEEPQPHSAATGAFPSPTGPGHAGLQAPLSKGKRADHVAGTYTNGNPALPQGCGRAEGWAAEALEVCKKWQWAERAPCSHSDRCQAHSSALWTLGLIVLGCKRAHWSLLALMFKDSGSAHSRPSPELAESSRPFPSPHTQTQGQQSHHPHFQHTWHGSLFSDLR